MLYVILWGFVFYQNDVPHVICEGFVPHVIYKNDIFAMLYVRVCIL